MSGIKEGSNIARALIYVLMVVFVILAIYPLCWLVIQSFKTTQEYLTSSKLALPKNWYAGNYPYAWEVGKFGTLFINSFIYTSVTIVSVVVLGFMASFAFAKIKNKFTPFLHGIFIIGILLTVQSIMIPLFLMVNWVKLYDTRLGVLIPYIGLGLPIGVYLGTEFIRNIPDALVESARIDGAKYLKIFAFIIFPMTSPVAITLAILTFTATWNEFMLINILASSDAIKSIPIGISRFSGALSTDYSKQFCALVMGMTPMVIFYLIFRKQITKGVAAGAVKY